MDAARPRYLIVDGHSVIFAWDELRAVHQRDPRRARLELLKHLSDLQDGGSDRIVVVFDGRGRATKSSRAHPVDVQIVYSSRGATADAVIEKLVAHYAESHDLTVVTADGGERLAVAALGAWWMSPDQLRQRVDGCRRDREKALASLRGRGGGQRLGEAITAGKRATRD